VRTLRCLGAAAAAVALAAGCGGEDEPAPPPPPAPTFAIEAVFRSPPAAFGPGTPVRIAGVKVGEVTAVERLDRRDAVATFRLTEGARPIRRDAAALLRPRLYREGAYFVDLRPGSSYAPPLPDGARIPVEQTGPARAP
jgi:hypothetical protein